MADFNPGDHLRVCRGLYYDHGLYVGDKGVLQFGGRVADKPHARVDDVPLSCFVRRGKAEVVDQRKLTWVGLWKLPPALPPERIVARARCLAQVQPEGVYNLIGRNCETVALWCVCGMGESLQRQRFQVVWALFGGLASLHIARLVGRQRGRTSRQQAAVWAFLALWATLLFMYYRHNRRFYRTARACDHA
jgi:Lecithin retinol acyltransferase